MGVKTETAESRRAIFEEAKALIAANLYDQLSVADLIELLDIGSGTLYRVFFDNCRLNPSQYIQKARAEEIERLVRETHYTQSDITNKMGICRATLTQSFMQHTGMTISEYRRRHPMLKQGGVSDAN